MNKLINRFNKINSDYETRINDLKLSMEITRKSLGAEKQIQFNEAIKKLSADKDRQIEELKLKQVDYLNRIYTLERELSTSTNHLTMQV